MWQVLICIVFTLGIIAYSVFFSYGEAHMPMILSVALVSIVGALNGWKWSVMEKGMVQGISRSMQANLILLTVGMLVSTWKAGGIIPSMIYYGLNIINPALFLVTAKVAVYTDFSGNRFFLHHSRYDRRCYDWYCSRSRYQPGSSSQALLYPELTPVTRCLRCPTPPIWLLP